MEIICFSDLLNGLIGDNINGNTQLENRMKDMNIPISARSIRSFRNSSKVPKIETAVNLLKALDVNLSIDQIIKSLELEKEKQMNFDEDSQNILDRHVKLSLYELSDELGFDDIDISKVLEDRMALLYPDDKKGRFNKYVKELILLDLKSHVLKD